MYKGSSTTIEHLAVMAVNSLIVKLNTKLESEISLNDKGVSFDGYINLYKNSSLRKTDLLGKAPVQVKGKTVKKISALQSKFSVELADLRNYYSEGGVIFFVGEIKDDKIVVFSKHLLPLDLKALIDNYGSQDTTTIYLKPVVDNKSLEVLCNYFLKERKRQPVNYVGKFSFASNEFESMKATSISLDSINGAHPLLNQEMYVYGVNGEIEVPVSVLRLMGLKQKGGTYIEIGGSPTLYHYEIDETDDRIMITLEEFLFITARRNSKDVKLKLEKPKSLESFEKVMLFLNKVVNEGSISLFNKAVVLEDLKWKKEEFIDIEVELNAVARIKKIYRAAGIPDNYKFRGSFLEKMPVLHEIFIEKNYESIKIEDKSKIGMLQLKFGDDYLLTFYSPTGKEEIQSVASEAFKEINIQLVTEDGDHHYKVTPFLLTSPEGLLETANVTLQLLKAFLNNDYHTYNDVTFQATNNFCLGCIKAFDNTNNKEYLELGKLITSNILNSNLVQDEIKSIALINELQILLRLGEELSEAQQQMLIEIKENPANVENAMLKLCCSVVLGNKQEAKYYFNKLPENEKLDFITFPIYKLYQ